jgi:hypothetical protein
MRPVGSGAGHSPEIAWLKTVTLKIVTQTFFSVKTLT